MLKHFPRSMVLFAALLLAASGAQAQSPSPEALAAAKELITTMNLTAQFKAILPTVVNALKPAIVQGRPEVERDYDAIMPIISEAFIARTEEISGKIAAAYANNFAAEDLRAINAFYRTPTGQRMLQKTPAVTAQTMAIGQEWGKSVANDLKDRLIQEMRKKGHNI